jgi:hypothetical protein
MSSKRFGWHAEVLLIALSALAQRARGESGRGEGVAVAAGLTLWILREERAHPGLRRFARRSSNRSKSLAGSHTGAPLTRETRRPSRRCEARRKTVYLDGVRLRASSRGCPSVVWRTLARLQFGRR